MDDVCSVCGEESEYGCHGVEDGKNYSIYYCAKHYHASTADGRSKSLESAPSVPVTDNPEKEESEDCMSRKKKSVLERFITMVNYWKDRKWNLTKTRAHTQIGQKVYHGSSVSKYLAQAAKKGFLEPMDGGKYKILKKIPENFVCE